MAETPKTITIDVLTVPSVTDVLAKVKANALREAAARVYGDERAAGPYSDPLSIASWLRSEADQIDRILEGANDD